MADLDAPPTTTPYTSGGVVGPPGSALEAAQQQLRELREEQFNDLSSAVRAVHEERRKLVGNICRLTSIKYTFQFYNYSVRIIISINLHQDLR